MKIKNEDGNIDEKNVLKELSVEDQIIIADMILNPAKAHDGLVSTLRDHSKHVEVR